MPRRKPKPATPHAGIPPFHTPRRWQLQEAKAKFSQVVKEAQKKPQVITLRGEEVAVIESINHYRSKHRPAVYAGPNLFEALLKCPPGPPLVIDRDPNDTVGAATPDIFD